jgi:hypothetical protein
MPNTCKSNEICAKLALCDDSGERVRNAWVMYLLAGYNLGKLGLIPNKLIYSFGKNEERLRPPRDRPASHQLVGEVMAHQGNDG